MDGAHVSLSDSSDVVRTSLVEGSSEGVVRLRIDYSRPQEIFGFEPRASLSRVLVWLKLSEAGVLQGSF